MFTRKCPKCDRELTYKQKSQVIEAIKNNRKCASCATTRVGLNTKCDHCGKMFYRRPSDMRTLNFCSQKCRGEYYTGKFKGKNSPSWKGGPEKSQIREIKKQREKRAELKRKGIEYFGGKCQNCGYNKCITSLDFHYPDPFKKDEDFNKKCEKSWEVMKSKIEECLLLCKNCHTELHWNERQKMYEKEITL
jgi:hypothetical protein